MVENALMLIFKKDIYRQANWAELTENHEIPTYKPIPQLSPYAFLLSTLVADRQIFIDLTHRDENEAHEHLKTLFPHASGFGNTRTLNTISKKLLEALVNKDQWHGMNAYHFCYLHDALAGMVEDYSYSDKPQRMEMFPELDGYPIDYSEFLDDYFFNTAFLVDPSRFNALLPGEKARLGNSMPCLFGVINQLSPSPEEIQLVIHPGDPYAPENRQKRVQAF